MKWFKHMSVSRNDEKIDEVFSVFEKKYRSGHIGYAFYFMLLEIVAENMGACDKHSARFSVKSWGQFTRLSHKKFADFAQILHEIGVIFANFSGDFCEIKIPNLLKYRDEHTRKLANKKQKTQEQDIDTDKEIDIEEEYKEKEKSYFVTPKEKDPPPLPASDASLCHPVPDAKQKIQEIKTAVKRQPSGMERPPDVDESVWDDFCKLRKAKRAPMTSTALRTIENEATKAGMTLNAALETCCARGWQGFKAEWMADQKSGSSLADKVVTIKGHQCRAGDLLSIHALQTRQNGQMAKKLLFGEQEHAAS